MTPSLITSLFLIVALINMIIASITTFYGPRLALVFSAACSLLAWLAIFLAAGKPFGWGLLASLPWTALLLLLGWQVRNPRQFDN